MQICDSTKVGFGALAHLGYLIEFGRLIGELGLEVFGYEVGIVSGCCTDGYQTQSENIVKLPGREDDHALGGRFNLGFTAEVLDRTREFAITRGRAHAGRKG